MQEPRISLQPGEERENFLQSCSRADKETTVACNMGIKFEEKAVIVSNQTNLFCIGQATVFG